MLDPFCTELGKCIVLEFLKQGEDLTVAFPFLRMTPQGLAMWGLSDLACQSLATGIGNCHCGSRSMSGRLSLRQQAATSTSRKWCYGDEVALWKAGLNVWLYVKKSSLSGDLAQPKPDGCGGIIGCPSLMGVPFAHTRGSTSRCHLTAWAALPVTVRCHSWAYGTTNTCFPSATCFPQVLLSSGGPCSVRKLHTGISEPGAWQLGEVGALGLYQLLPLLLIIKK